MRTRYEMRFTGSGGQGVILASVILAEAAVLSGQKAVQSQAYGPEARGGLCRAEIVLSSEQIWFSKVIQPELLLALTQASLDKYAPDIAPGAVVMVDSSLNVPAFLPPEQVISVPILDTGKNKVGNPMIANVVAVGAINAALGLFDQKALREAVRRHIPAGTEVLNWKALEEGSKLISPEQAKKYHRDLC